MEDIYSINLAEHPVLGLGTHWTITIEDAAGSIVEEIKASARTYFPMAQEQGI
jgi:hypothetical protein